MHDCLYNINRKCEFDFWYVYSIATRDRVAKTSMKDSIELLTKLNIGVDVFCTFKKLLFLVNSESI